MNKEELLQIIENASKKGETSLELDCNQLSKLPPEIGKLKKLTVLDLSDNQLSELPPEIGKLKKLTSLDINCNQLRELPPEIVKLTKLDTLDCAFNSLTTLSPEITKLTNITALSLADNTFTEPPIDQIKELGNLTILLLCGMHMSEFPMELIKMENLTYLNISENQLTELPTEIGKLNKLTELDLSQNQLTELPQEIGKLNKLTELLLSQNQLTELPTEIGKLNKLTKLDLSQNQLTELPTEIGKLNKLTELDLSQNQLTELPTEIGKLNKLTELDLSQNQLTKLPTELHQLEALKYLRLNDNPDLRFPPEEIVALGTKGVMNYLRAAHAGSTHVWESKLLIVGEGGVGKTSLFNALNGKFLKGYETGTVGIEIGDLFLPYPGKVDIEMHLNCWDFAGQDFNYATHQFFFSNRALYLLVWNARHGYRQGKLYRWLENIKVRSPQAKVILVSTHIDEPHSDYPLADLRAKYPQIVEVAEVSNKDRTGIEELRGLIQKQAEQLPLMGLRWPATWLKAAETTRALSDQHITRRKLEELIQENGLDENETQILMRWLHDLGDILHFHDEEMIRDLVVLDPEWMIKHVGLALRSDEVKKRQGILTRIHLRELWPDLDGYIQDHFLRMMDKFDLAYLIPDDPDDRSLIVERLSYDPVDYKEDWDAFKEAGSEIKLRFRLGSMQPGIPSWFIARCHRFTMGKHWLFGVLFKDAKQPRHLALVEADPENGIVDMTVRGPFPQRFMSLLRDGFRDTLKRYKGLAVELLVPCSGYNEYIEEPCKNEFKLDLLESKLIKNPSKINFNCNDCDTTLSSLELVEGIGSGALTQEFTEERIAALIKKEHEATRKDIKGHIDIRIEDVIAFHQRNFINLWRREQERELVTCPNIFTLKSVGKGNLFTAKKFQLQLYCQQPGEWHSIGEDGFYEFSQTREWLEKAAPYMMTLLKVLNVVVPLASAATAVAAGAMEVSKATQGIIANDFKLMSTLITQAGKLNPAADSIGAAAKNIEEPSTYQKFAGAELGVIRELMDQLADRAPKWGGLTRRQTPEGDILWLCKDHLHEYESKRKIVLPGEVAL